MSLAIGTQPRTPSGFERLPGVTPPSSREPRPGFLTDTIIALGLADAEQVQNAINESRVRGVAPESLLVELGELSAEALARARAEHAGLDYVDLSEFDRDTDRDALIGREAAARNNALPIAVEGRALVVALADPIDAPVVAEITAAHKLELIPVVAAADAIAALIEELPEREHSGEPEPPSEPVRLQPIEGGATARHEPISAGLADRIVERVDAAIDEVARSEILRALDDATAEIERLSAELEQAEQRATALASERDELRAAAGQAPDPE